jgi:hypothetical protein
VIPPDQRRPRDCAAAEDGWLLGLRTAITGDG